MDFYFSGDLDNLKDYIDFNSIDLISDMTKQSLSFLTAKYQLLMT